MRFRNDIHKRRFEKEIKKMDKKDNTQMAIVFLLTANLALISTSKNEEASSCNWNVFSFYPCVLIGDKFFSEAERNLRTPP